MYVCMYVCIYVCMRQSILVVISVLVSDRCIDINVCMWGWDRLGCSMAGIIRSLSRVGSTECLVLCYTFLPPWMVVAVVMVVCYPWNPNLTCHLQLPPSLLVIAEGTLNYRSPSMHPDLILYLLLCLLSGLSPPSDSYRPHVSTSDMCVCMYVCMYVCSRC